jgi:DNA ligase-4
MLKDPDSLYVPKERSVNWLKLKGDYVDGLTDTLDLVILGGYFGNLSYRVGQGGHWSDKVTTFLLGIIEKIDSENQHNSHAIPFCKVGTGYSGDDLQQLRNKLKPFLVQNDGNKKPSFLVGNWKPKIDDRPDCYISSLPNSVILEVKGAELMASDTFGAPVTLRFPRVVKIRYDKDWN